MAHLFWGRTGLWAALGGPWDTWLSCPSSGFWPGILKALISLLWGWGLTEVVPRLPWSCEGSPKEAGVGVGGPSWE